VSSVFYRGPRSAPRWFARYRDAGGAWRSKRVRVDNRKDAMKIATTLEAQAERRRYGLEAPESATLNVGELLKRWENSLVNRSAYDDRSRLRLHIVPRFGSMRLADLTLPALLAWLDDLKTRSTLSPGTQGALLTLMVRFCEWLVMREFIPINYAKQVPRKYRPPRRTRRDHQTIDDDALVRRIVSSMPPPFGLMFYVGNQCGLRLGEICGLRIADVDGAVDGGSMPVRHSYNQPLKEDARGIGIVKRVPVPIGFVSVLGPWIQKRRAEGATGEAFLFMRERERHFRKEHVEHRWEKFRSTIGIGASWSDATRESFKRRSLRRGVSLDEVASALGNHPSSLGWSQLHVIGKAYSPSLLSGAGFLVSQGCGL
jgi:integrase